MRIILFGATGMIGRGVLLECLADPDVSHVLSIGRRATDMQHVKLEQIVHDDFTDYSGTRRASRRVRRVLLLSRCLVRWDERGTLSPHHIRLHPGCGPGAPGQQSGPCLLLCLRRRCRHQRARPFHVGQSERQDRERPAEAALRGCLHVSSRVCPYGQGCHASTALAPCCVLLRPTALPHTAGSPPATCDHG